MIALFRPSILKCKYFAGKKGENIATVHDINITRFNYIFQKWKNYGKRKIQKKNPLNLGNPKLSPGVKYVFIISLQMAQIT